MQKSIKFVEHRICINKTCYSERQYIVGCKYSVFIDTLNRYYVTNYNKAYEKGVHYHILLHTSPYDFYNGGFSFEKHELNKWFKLLPTQYDIDEIINNLNWN